MCSQGPDICRQQMVARLGIQCMTDKGFFISADTDMHQWMPFFKSADPTNYRFPFFHIGRYRSDFFTYSAHFRICMGLIHINNSSTTRVNIFKEIPDVFVYFLTWNYIFWLFMAKFGEISITVVECKIITRWENK